MTPWNALADAVLVAHLAVVLFVVGGLAAVVAGNLRGWRWVNRPAWRWLHAGAIGFVVLQALLGQDCPLTVLESWLRRQGGGSGYSGGFIQHGVQAVLFYSAPVWVFALLYVGFGALVALAWWRWPPR